MSGLLQLPWHVPSSRIRHMIDLAAHIARFQVYSYTAREDAIHAIEEHLGRENSPIQP